MKIRYTDRSREDIEIAVVWYEKQRAGLGMEFLDSAESALERIGRFPEIYPFRYSKYRGCPIKRFPFILFYTIEDRAIIVHSFFDSRQDPVKRP
ncbi:MAG: type II toxin-antitoxin system RelE/ParE family toxin [Desulfococcaceae bacterium]